MEETKPRGFCIFDFDIYLACLSLAVLIFITVGGVFMRYFANRPLPWLEEVQLWCFVWAVFAGIVYVARINSHIAIDAIVTLFPHAFRRFMAIVSNLATIGVLAFLGYYSSFHVLQMYNRKRFTNILEIPYWLIYLVVPLSCLLIIIITLRRFVAPGDPEAKHEGA